MFFKEKWNGSTFAYALGGAAVAGTFVPMPVIVNRRINDAWDERLKSRQETSSPARKEGGLRRTLRNALHPSRAC